MQKIKEKLFLNPIKYTLGFVVGLVFASGLVYAWNAVWHGTDWIQPGVMVRSEPLAESLQYLYDITRPLNNLTVCTGTGKALQYDGTSLVCAEINNTSTTSTNMDCEAQNVNGTIKVYNSCTGETYNQTTVYSCPVTNEGQIASCTDTAIYSSAQADFLCTSGAFIQMSVPTTYSLTICAP